MIVAERKPFEEIKTLLKGCNKVLTVGCGTCVAVCLAGGEKEVNILKAEIKMARQIEGNPIEIEGVTLERQCDMEFLNEIDDSVNEYDALLSTACGVGVQFLAERYPDKPVFPALDTSGLSANRDVGWYEEKCRACGTCVLGITGGICPITMCAKGLLNGPCGGTHMESCEINKDQPCAWYMIYQRLAKQNRLDQILEIFPPVDWRNQTPRTLIQPGYKKRKSA